MPPRFAYWTIILDGVPTSFRAHDQAELLPTFNQLKRKNPAALMKWFSGGKLWDSPEQAREERQLERTRQFRVSRDKEEQFLRRQRDDEPRESNLRGGGFDQRDRAPRDDRPVPRVRPAAERPQLDGNDPATVELRRRIAERAARAPQTPPPSPAPKDAQPPGPPKGEARRSDSTRLEPERPPMHESRPRPPKRDDRRPKAWRPGGEHRDPRDKYKLPPGEARKRWKSRNLGPKSGKPSGAGAAGSRPPGKSFAKPFSPAGSRPPGKSFAKPFNPAGSRPPGKSTGHGSGIGKAGGGSGFRPRGRDGFRGPGKGTPKPPGRGRR